MQVEPSCISCGASLERAGCLWDVSPALLCPGCYSAVMPIPIARGILCREDSSLPPSVEPGAIIKIETDARMVWSSVSSRWDLTLSNRTVPEGSYYGLYTKIWRYPGGNRISTAHMLDGRTVSIGARLPAVGTPLPPLGVVTPKPEMRSVGTMTETLIWLWNDKEGEINEHDPITSTVGNQGAGNRGSSAEPPKESPTRDPVRPQPPQSPANEGGSAVIDITNEDDDTMDFEVLDEFLAVNGGLNTPVLEVQEPGTPCSDEREIERDPPKLKSAYEPVTPESAGTSRGDVLEIHAEKNDEIEQSPVAKRIKHVKPIQRLMTGSSSKPYHRPSHRPPHRPLPPPTPPPAGHHSSYRHQQSKKKAQEGGVKKV